MARRRSEKPQPPFAARLEETRVSYGMLTSRPEFSKGEFAQMLGLGEEAYRRYERGESYPNVETLRKIREITGITLDYLVCGIVPVSQKAQPAKPKLRSVGHR